MMTSDLDIVITYGDGRDVKNPRHRIEIVKNCKIAQTPSYSCLAVSMMGQLSYTFHARLAGGDSQMVSVLVVVSKILINLYLCCRYLVRG